MAEMIGVKRPFTSVRIETPERAGRAPYNFVPLAGEEWTKADAPPPPADCFDMELLTPEV